MVLKHLLIKPTAIVGLVLIVFLSLNIATTKSAAVDVTPIWSTNLQHTRCTSPSCETSSPVLVDLTGDGVLDIVLATSNGWVMAIRNNGTLLWETDVAAYFGMAANTQHINSSPAVADIDNDGHLEIVVGTGATGQGFCTQGGVIVLDHNGKKQVGWPYRTSDDVIPPVGCTDTVFSTPALGDLDKDGDMEIVVGSFDKRIYILHHNGTVDSNFPIDSAHSVRFPSWKDLKGKLADTIWSSPSLADMNGDGYLDIILGTDEGNFGSSWGSWPGNWTCSYSLPSYLTQDYCGGALYVIDRQGNHLPGFPKHIHEVISSSPTIYDIDRDGFPEIFVGAGNFYYNNSADHPTMSFRIYGWDNQGNDLPGWSGGKVTGGSTPASPAIGDISGDGMAEIVALSMDHKLYAWKTNGTPVAGFPMIPTAGDGGSNAYNVGDSPVLGDYDGDGKMEVFIRTGWHVTVVDGDGIQLTKSSNTSIKPLFTANGLLQNNPAVGDIDNDGKLELVAHNTTLYVWDLPTAGSKADWPMFRYNAARTGHLIQPMIIVAPSTAFTLLESSDTDDVQFTITLNDNSGQLITWSAISDNPDATVFPAGGTFVGETTFKITVDSNSLSMGENVIGNVTITGKANNLHMINSPTSIPVTVLVVDKIHAVFLPIAIDN